MTTNPGTALTTADQATEVANAGATAPTRQFSRREITLLQHTIAKDLTMPEISLFIQASRHYQLDPFSRQIYAIKRGSGDRAQLTIQISIDGFRVIAERNPEYAGQTSPEFLDRDGVWHEGIWLADIYPGIGLPGVAEGPFPLAARVGIRRKGWPEPVYGYAAWREYAQFTSQGLASMWATMPGNQLAKCAESLGLRKAFPNDLSGAYSSDEMAQAGQNPPEVVVEGMTMVQLEEGSKQDGPALEGEVTPPSARPAQPRGGSARAGAPAAGAPARQAQAARSAAGGAPAASAPAQPAVEPSSAPAQAAEPTTPVSTGTPSLDPSAIRTVNQLMRRLEAAYEYDEATLFRILNVSELDGIRNLGIQKTLETVRLYFETVDPRGPGGLPEAARNDDDIPFDDDDVVPGNEAILEGEVLNP